MTTTVGEFLRKTRIDRDITLEQVSQDTRVKLAYLQAIEQNEPSELPSVVQARGFLRLYANYLNLPAQPLLDGWQSGYYTIPEAPAHAVETSMAAAAESQAESTTVESQQPEMEREIAEEMKQAFEEKPEPVSDKAELRQSQQIFQDIGRQLQVRRQELSLSIGDVERFTKLRRFYIEALEEGRIEELPSMVQGRGMLTSYAEFLDLDAESLLLEFADALQNRRLELISPSPFGKQTSGGSSGRKRSGHVPSWRRVLSLDLVLGGSLFIFLIGFVLWSAARITNLSREASVPTPPSISEMLKTPANGSISPTLEITTTAINGQVSGNTLPGAANPQEAANPTEFTIPTLNSAPISVYIVASQRAWMRVTVDNSVLFDGRVSPGNAYPFTGRERIDLITGNGAALSVVYNQTDMGNLGRMGEVVSISFTREGTQIPTPVPTATPTQTLQPTATRQPTLPQITPSITPLIP